MTTNVVQTEVLGKSFEKAVCLLVGCEFQGNYRYSLEKANDIKTRLEPLASEFVGFQHTGATDDLYDFSDPTDHAKRLSCKTNTRGWKVCPQGGQVTKKTFCEKFGLPVSAHTDPEAIKAFVVSELPRILDTFVHSTFHCPMLYYNEPSNLVWMIKQIKPIDWTTEHLIFSHINKSKPWNESTTLYVMKGGSLVTIGEFQNHRNRNCFKFRWDFKHLLESFKDCFEARVF
jgi:hypothetical protein